MREEHGARLDDAGIARWRLRRQGLVDAPFASPPEVVGFLTAVQAQEYALAKWAVGQRAASGNEPALDRALATGAILRTHVMRPTWHMVLPADIRWLLALTAPRVHAASAHAYRRLGLAEADFRRAEELFVHAMQGGKDLSRAEIVRLLEGAGVDTAGQRLGYLLMHAELEGIISSGAPRGKQRTYALLAERAPAARELSPDEALAELTLRYLRSHGPATLRDYRWWSGLTAADARRGLEMVLSALDHLEVGGHTYWFEGAPPAEPLPAPVAHLLQGYDELFMGYSETRGVLDVARLSQGTWTNPGAFVHGVLVDGQIVGRWRRVLAAREVIVELLLLRPLALDERRALDVAVAHYGTFAGLPACTRDVSPAEG